MLLVYRLCPKGTKTPEQLMVLSVQPTGLAFLFHKTSCSAELTDQFWILQGGKVGEVSMQELICEPGPERVWEIP